ncbi:MAG: glycine cleavage system aminomethyltransferase GcvT [Actinobacteria bacterium]|nr:glycine cleavage system aminomethyltransferase GcvT [Actinomycetota bacterium]
MAGARETHLLDAHKRLGARIVEFGGWDMPLQYSGVVAEHNAVRHNAGVFDVSHLGKLRVTSPQGSAALQHAVTADIEGLVPGQASYALVLTDDAGTVDDIFIYRVAEHEWLVVPNAANVTAVAEMIEASGTEVADEWDRWAILAIQGPRSFEVFDKVFPGSGATDLKLHRFTTLDVLGEEGMVARTGYTGERGFELYAPAAVAEPALERILDAGAAPVGLGARDTLRLEMGYALYGHELTRDINPLEASLGWAVKWDPDFRGKEALSAVKETGPARRLFGIACTGRGVPRQGCPVFAGEQRIGELTSGNFSPTLGTGIGLALGPRELTPEVGQSVAIEARGRRIEGDIVKPPFIKRA